MQSPKPLSIYAYLGAAAGPVWTSREGGVVYRNVNVAMGVVMRAWAFQYHVDGALAYDELLKETNLAQPGGFASTPQNAGQLPDEDLIARATNDTLYRAALLALAAFTRPYHALVVVFPDRLSARPHGPWARMVHQAQADVQHQPYAGAGVLDTRLIIANLSEDASEEARVISARARVLAEGALA